MGIEWPQLLWICPIVQLEPDRTHEPPDARKEEFGIAHTGLDFEGRDSEIAQVGRMPQVPEYEDGTKCHEEQPN